MAKINFIETVYIENGYSFKPLQQDLEGGLQAMGEITSGAEVFRITWDAEKEAIVVEKKDQDGNWQKSGFTTYHQKKIDAKENKYSVTVGDFGGKMIFQGIFEAIR
jgi:hypothetical protein